MSQDWYYAINNQQHGPVSEAELRDLADRGRLGPRDLVWKDGMAEWVPASTVRQAWQVPSPPSGPCRAAAKARAATDRPEPGGPRQPVLRRP